MKLKYWVLCMLACQLVLGNSYAGSCVWEPSGGSTIPVDADITVSAYPGDPAPDNSEFCGCDSNDDPVNWTPTGEYKVVLSGDVSGGKLITSTPGAKTVTANISYEYSCDADGSTKWEDDTGNPWTRTYTVSNYWIDGPSPVDKNEQASYTVQSSAGMQPTVSGWETSGGAQSGSGVTIQVTWSSPGEKSVTATVDGHGPVSLGVSVIGDLAVEIESPSGPHVVAKDESVTFVAKDPQGGVGPYTYEWSFQNGTAPAGGTSQKTVSGVKFGIDAEGNKNEVTLTVRDSQGNSGQDSIDIIVPKIREQITGRKLWYLNDGAAASPYYTNVTIEVFDGNSGLPYTWECANSEVSLTESGNITTKVVAEQGSSSENDITLSLKYQNKQVASMKLTVYTPAWYNFLYYADIPLTLLGLWFGYTTEAYFEMTDQFDNRLESLAINEQWLFSSRSDYISNNWPSPKNVSGFLDSMGRGFDSYGTTGGPLLSPASVTPSSPDAASQVYTLKQYYRAGSGESGKGVLVEIHNVDFCRGRARQW